MHFDVISHWHLCVVYKAEKPVWMLDLLWSRKWSVC